MLTLSRSSGREAGSRFMFSVGSDLRQVRAGPRPQNRSLRSRPQPLLTPPFVRSPVSLSTIPALSVDRRGVWEPPGGRGKHPPLSLVSYRDPTLNFREPEACSGEEAPCGSDPCSQTTGALGWPRECVQCPAVHSVR